MTPPIDPRIRQRRAAVQRGKGRRRLRIVVAVVMVAALVAGALVLVHSSLFDTRVVTVTGSHPNTPTAAIVAAAGLAGRPPLIDVDTHAAATRIEALPFIATATVSRQWPDGVHIAVTERVASVTMTGPGSSWSQLDGAGRTLQVQPTRAAGLVLLAVNDAKGPVPPAAVGGSLPASAEPGLQVCRSLPVAFVAQVVSVTVAPDATVSLALNSGLTVLLGTATDLSAKYEDVAAIIAHASLRGAKTIDVTVPQSPTVSNS